MFKNNCQYSETSNAIRFTVLHSETSNVKEQLMLSQPSSSGIFVRKIIRV